MRRQRSLVWKMLFSIGISVAVIFSAAAAVIITTMKQSVDQLSTSDLASRSQAAACEIDSYFSKYEEIARQMAASSQFQELFTKTTRGTSIVKTDGFSAVKKTLVNVQKTDPENIIVSWVADIDSSQLTQSDGYTSAADWNVTKRPWYETLVQKQDVVITEPYQDTSTKKWIVSVVAPVYQTGTKTLLGVTSIDFSLDNLYKMVSGYKLGSTGFYMLTTASGQFIYHPDQKLKDTNVQDADMSANIIEAITGKKTGAITYTAMGQTNYGYVSSVGNSGWTVTTGLPEKEFNSALNTVLTSIFLIFLVSLVLMALVIMLVSGSIVRPLKKLKNVAQKIADGDLNVQIDVRSNDEIGRVSEAFSRTVDRLKQYIEYIDEISAALDQIALGNLAFRLHCEYTGEFSKIKTALANIKSTLTRTFSEIEKSADQVASGSDQVANASQALAQGATEQASAIQQLSASITEIADQVKTNAGHASNASRLAGESFTEVERGNEHMQRMMAAMNEISESSGAIGKIIKTIEDIAFQTNILALNAAVEAARAGAAGKGFAVVADEVRNLASKSAEAAKNTTSLIQSSIRSVENGTKIAQETAQSLNVIIDSTKKTTDLIGKISAATGEQATSIQQVTQGVDQISAVVQTNSATSEESAASSEELNSQAQNLKELVRYFKVEDSAQAPRPEEPGMIR
ncbi:MAG: HAMP domain-containing protein [Clostridiales bacterium]|nr:HAMP domain-containing protein [Clostridiales bacterium]